VSTDELVVVDGAYVPLLQPFLDIASDYLNIEDEVSVIAY